MPTTVMVRKVADWRGVKLEDEQADRLGMWLHNGFGAAGGRSPPSWPGPSRSGPCRPAWRSAGMFVFVDEGASYVLGFTPPAPEWPLITHLRALAAHLVYGLTLGSFLAVADRVVDRR